MAVYQYSYFVFSVIRLGLCDNGVCPLNKRFTYYNYAELVNQIRRRALMSDCPFRDLHYFTCMHQVNELIIYAYRRTGTGRYSDNRCSDKVRTVASERNPVCGGKVSSKPKGLTRCEVLGSGGKPLPWHQLGDRAAL